MADKDDIEIGHMVEITNATWTILKNQLYYLRMYGMMECERLDLADAAEGPISVIILDKDRERYRFRCRTSFWDCNLILCNESDPDDRGMTGEVELYMATERDGVKVRIGTAYFNVLG